MPSIAQQSFDLFNIASNDRVDQIIKKQTVGDHVLFLTKVTGTLGCRSIWLKQNQIHRDLIQQYEIESRQAKDYDNIPHFHTWRNSEFTIEIPTKVKMMDHWIYGDRVVRIKKRIGEAGQKGLYLVEWYSNKNGLVKYESLKHYEKDLLINFEIRQSMKKMIQQVSAQS